MNEQQAQIQLGIMHMLTMIESQCRSARESIVHGQAAMQQAMQPKLSLANEGTLSRLTTAAEIAAKNGQTLHVKDDKQAQAIRIAQGHNANVQNCIGNIIGNAKNLEAMLAATPNEEQTPE